MTRSSSPSYRPATSNKPGSVENSLAIACVKGSPCADKYTRGDPCGSLAAAASIAAVIGSGLSTMPGPPPYGRSSTVRCTSPVCARGSSQPRRTMPRSTARPSTPGFTASRTSSGNNVTTSKCMTSKILGPIHRQQSLALVDDQQVLLGHRNQVLAFASHHHHRVGGRVDEMIDRTQQRAIQVHHRESDEVRAVMFAPLGRRQLFSTDQHQPPGQPARGIAFVDTFEPRDPA